MEHNRASMTALGAALMRAVHTRRAPSPLIEDPWGDRLVAEHERESILRVVLDALTPHARERCQQLETPALALDEALQLHPGYGWAIIRARYAEDALARTVRRGLRQYVIVGAGFDTFALRRPAFAGEVEVFEVDHPGTQQLKRERLGEVGVHLPATLHFVPADLGRVQIGDALAESSFRAGKPAFFSWLGVTQYLTRPANLLTLRGIGRSAPGSELVFTYVDEREMGGASASSDLVRLQGAFATAREPWLSGFDPSSLGAELRAVGLQLLEDLDGDGARRRYGGDDRGGLVPVAASHIAHARVAAPPVPTA